MKRGFTLIECLVGVTAGSVLLAAACAVLLAGQRAAVALAVALDARGSSDAAAAVLTAELRTMAAGELIRASDSAVSLRALRAAGFVCLVEPSRARVTLDGSLLSLVRAIDPLRDSVRLLVEGNVEQTSDDAWVQAGIVTASTRSCPGGGSGEALVLSGVSAALLAAIDIGAPARVVEIVEYRRYVSGGEHWFGVRSPSGAGWSASSPIAGPLDPIGGLLLTWRDEAGAATLAPDSVVLVEGDVRIRSRAAWSPSGVRVVRDSASIAVGARP